MGISNRQIGWSSKEILLWQIAKQLEKITYQAANFSGGGGGGGGVSSVGLTSSTGGINISGSPVVSSGNLNFEINTANGSGPGLLSSSDWTAFNNKQGALTLTTSGTSGPATLIGNTLNVPQYSGGGIIVLGSGCCSTLRCGVNNCADGVYSSVLGQCNVVCGTHSSVVGGILNTASGNCSFVGNGLSNAASGSSSSVVGGFCNIVNAPSAAILGGYNNFIDTQSPSSYIGGGYCNSICTSSANYICWPAVVVSGIGNNTCGGTFSSLYEGCFTTPPIKQLSGPSSFIGNGFQNRACAHWSTVLNGNRNVVSECYGTVLNGFCNVASGCFSLVVNGSRNTVSQIGGTIVNGTCNCLLGGLGAGFIGQGFCNVIDVTALSGFIGNGTCGLISNSCCSSILQGTRNCICGLANFSSIISGLDNRITGPLNYAFIGQGTNNVVLSSAGFIGTGFQNTISASCGFIGTGVCNTVSGGYSAILGGRGNVASACFSGAFGCNINASNPCTFYANNFCACCSIFTACISSGCAVCATTNGQLIGYTPSGGTTTNAVTFNNSGTGDSSGTTFNGSVARTISFNTVGANKVITSGTAAPTGGVDGDIYLQYV